MRSGVTLRLKRSEKILHLSTGYVIENYGIVCTVNNAGKARRKERKMADKFFTQTTCDRCGGSLAGGRTMSMYNEQCICMACAEAEQKRTDYDKAREAERAAVKAGDRNFKGIGLR